MENCSFLNCKKIDRMANWVGTSVASAFFASLKRYEEEAQDRPLTLTKPVVHKVLEKASNGVDPSPI
ncbi:hypothetical protein AMTRI_Chr11g156640 [Amborella trichopoda]